MRPFLINRLLTLVRLTLIVQSCHFRPGKAPTNECSMARQEEGKMEGHDTALDIKAQHCGRIPFMPVRWSNQDARALKKNDTFLNRNSAKHEGRRRTVMQDRSPRAALPSHCGEGSCVLFRPENRLKCYSALRLHHERAGTVLPVNKTESVHRMCLF